jgi:threonine aldolase
MRQAGVLAAAGLIAIEESPKILYRDHENARYLADGLAAVEGIVIEPKKVQTNIVLFNLTHAKDGNLTAADFCTAIGKHKILASPTAKFTVRMVTHYDVNRAGIDRALGVIREVMNERG